MGKVRQNLIGLRLKEFRSAARPPLTQDALSRKIAEFDVHIDRAGIAKIESGIRSVLDFELVAIAKALDVRVTSLLGVME